MDARSNKDSKGNKGRGKKRRAANAVLRFF
jgi:hypothetical protein